MVKEIILSKKLKILISKFLFKKDVYLFYSPSGHLIIGFTNIQQTSSDTWLNEIKTDIYSSNKSYWEKSSKLNSKDKDSIPT